MHHGGSPLVLHRHAPSLPSGLRRTRYLRIQQAQRQLLYDGHFASAGRLSGEGRGRMSTDSSRARAPRPRASAERAVRYAREPRQCGLFGCRCVHGQSGRLKSAQERSLGEREVSYMKCYSR